MQREHWHKKDIQLNWEGQRLPLGVAQELFSSHDVDVGSRLLLKSLAPNEWGEEGHIVDFGCGYGVLGLGWLAVKPGWTATLIDRDALAVAFARDNADRNELVRATCMTGLGPHGLPSPGTDLLLWNVPGKAGEGVLAALTSDCISTLSEGGLLALVVVNPLAEGLRSVLASDPTITIEHDETHADHTIIHARTAGPAATAGDPFERGVFDREPAGFGVDDFDYDIVPVVGVPEYDTYSHATEVTFDVLRTVVGSPHSIFVFRPGQGHVPLVVSSLFKPGHLVFGDRDWLAVRAAHRALAGSGLPVANVLALPLVDLADAGLEGVDLAVLLLEDQVRNELHGARLADLATMLANGGQVIVSGGSSTVSRFLSFAAKRPGWKLRDRIKRSGASAARLERVA
ncbi:MAG TPA: methyltransferase [Thermomicrobiales bacterium]|nr:methyltransferase [Thermomicrobiales bacterium]